MSTVILFLLMCRPGVSQPNRMQMPRADNVTLVIADFPGQSPEGDAAYQECEFARRVDGLLRALHDFAASYRAGLVDVKKVKAVRKAMQDMEKSEWFKRQPTAARSQPGARKLR